MKNIYNRILRKIRKIFKHIIVGYDSYVLASKVKKNKGLFIDCGSNLGQGFSHFSSYFGLLNYDFVMIEPNPNCINILKENFSEHIKNGKIELIKKAAGTKEGILKLYGLSEKSKVDSIFNPSILSNNKFSQGASILKEHNSIFYDSNEDDAISVQTFSFSDFLKQKSKTYKTIVLKIDIEGAEYDLIEDLIFQKTIYIPDIIYAEFHSHFMKKDDRKKYQKIERNFLSFFKSSSIKFRPWN